jgi:crossover junction endodeoxyribonuclease RuvC
MRILGIDPGIATIGFGLVDYHNPRFTMLGYGAIKTEAGLPLSLRLEKLADGIGELIDRFSPDAASVEELFFNTNLKTGIQVAQGRGVILLECRRHCVPLYEYTPLQVKQAVVGYGRAEKKQVMLMTQRILNLDSIPRPDDAADALALAICHGHSSGGVLADNTV